MQLIWSTYYTDKIPHSSDPCGSFWWKDLLHLSDIYRGVTKVSVGNGRSTLFWKDLWHDNLLSDSHPRAFSYAKGEDLTIHDLLTAGSLGQVFHLPLSLEARQEINDLQLITRDFDPATDTSDHWLCSWGGTEFKTKKFYEHYFRNVQVDEAFCWI